MNRRLLSLATSILLLAAIAVASCSSRVPDTGTIEVEGILLLRGNVPHTRWVLVVSDTEQWELLGLSEASAGHLQRRQVKVMGQVHPDAPSASREPALVVLALSAL
jgi:hypothetical protein